MAKQPAFQFYPGDWLKDPRLSLCSEATRGIWIDMICAMHEMDRCGKITGTSEQLARVCRSTAVLIATALTELSNSRTADITERDGIYTIINRRMKRAYDERNHERDKKRKQRGGKTVSPKCPPDVPDCPRNVPLCASRRENGSVPLDVPEMSPTHSSSSSSSSKNNSTSDEVLVETPEKPPEVSPPEPTKRITRCPQQEILRLFHFHCPSLPKVRVKLSKTNAAHLRQRWKEHPELTWWSDYFEYVETSDFLTGRVEPLPGRNLFVAKFHWLILPSNMEKVLNGDYENRKAKTVWDQEGL